MSAFPSSGNKNVLGQMKSQKNYLVSINCHVDLKQSIEYSTEMEQIFISVIVLN